MGERPGPSIRTGRRDELEQLAGEAQKGPALNPLAESTKAQERRESSGGRWPWTTSDATGVARDRPLRDRQMVRSGVNRGNFTAILSADVRAKLERQGD